ncbi:endospore germination permease [Neobacillus sp. PS3-40]|uniref:GerAB/ArcD/ProY family transporter n=1 Tax=Neobacillus sp. PS3-40 TaxID=3070679 RepID=UPI0027E0D60C|nr:endospore germination permease [Neobacillus sp. PS3-40]WML44225.1 endospore germination permease [Neobacillus sp. PS3-40]
MIERGKISATQMAIMMNPAIMATVLLLVPAITAKNAKQDLWISPIWASLIGFLTVFLAYRLHKLYPNETLIEYSELILGKYLGKLIGAVILFYYLHVTGIIVLEYGEFVAGTFLPHTPMLVILGSMVIVCSFAVFGGLEVIGRCSEIIVPVVCLLYLFIFVLLLKDLHIQNMFPIMEGGLKSSFRGSVVPQSWFSEFILVSFFFPYLTDKEKGMKWGFISVFSVMFLMVLTNFTTLLLFGNLTAELTYPVMIAARYISVADFLEHLESIVMAIWVAGTFVKITVFYYVLVLGTAQLVKLSDFRPIVLPIGFLLILFGAWSAPNLQELAHFLSTSAAFYFLSFQVGIPIMLLSIALIRNKINQKKGSMTG